MKIYSRDIDLYVEIRLKQYFDTSQMYYEAKQCKNIANQS